MITAEPSRHPARKVTLIVIAQAVLALLFLLFALTWKQDRSDTSIQESNAAISTPSQINPLLSGNMETIAGDTVFLNDVRLLPGPSSNVFFAVGSQGTRILVVSDTRVLAAPDSIVDIEGVIRRLPSGSSVRKEWKLSKNAARTAVSQGIYIAAQMIQPQPPQ